MLLQTVEPARLEQELTLQIRARTGQRVRELAVEVWPDCVVLRGRTTSWYVKQLAQHSVRLALPKLDIRNGIVVDAAD